MDECEEYLNLTSRRDGYLRMFEGWWGNRLDLDRTTWYLRSLRVRAVKGAHRKKGVEDAPDEHEEELDGIEG